jgi:hypothetical protein
VVFFLAYGIVYDSLVSQVNSKTGERVEPFEEVEASRNWMGRKWLDKVLIRHKELFPNSHHRLLARLLLIFGLITAVCWRFAVPSQHRVESPVAVQAQDLDR